MLAKHYVRRYWDTIKKHSYDDRKGYNPDWIQLMLYNQMEVVIDLSIIKKVIKEVRKSIKNYKERKGIHKSNTDKKKKKSKES